MVARDPKYLQADSEGTDQAARMRRLMCVCNGRICTFAGNAVSDCSCSLFQRFAGVNIYQ